MRLADLQYDLPPERIAQTPVTPRDAARLLVLDRATGRIEHRVFRDIAEYCAPGDCLVLNDTRVIPARFFAQRASGGRIEALFLHAAGASGSDSGEWRVLLKPSARLRVGERLRLLTPAQGLAAGASHAAAGAPAPAEIQLPELVLGARGERGEWLVQPDPPVSAFELLARVGQTPLPPYIRRGAAGPAPVDAERYQTVYAERPGAVAAPTAGLHFTPELLARLDEGGVQRARVTLHVGAGTFVPIETADLAQHRMHAEWYAAPPAALQTLQNVRAAGGRILAVGTTSVRVLESLPGAALGAAAGHGSGVSGWTDIFIYPPYQFRHVDRLITNFHLPGSTLLALVMAFASPELIRSAYAEALERGYRFYSYGDAMLIL